MTPQELNAFYREVDLVERTMLQADVAPQYAAAALDAGRMLDDGGDDIVRVLARVAFRFANRELLARHRRTARAIRTAPRRRGPDLQAAADAGFDTWDDYHGER